MLIGVLFIFIIMGLLLWKNTRKPPLFPPGPQWLPIIGSLLLVQKLHKIHRFYHLVWYHMYQTYGSIVGLRIGNEHLIIVSGKEAIREFYNIDAFNGRPDGFFYRIRSFNKRLGVVFCDDEFWDVQRRFSVKVLRQLGMGRSIMIQHIEREAIDMVDYFRKQCDNGKQLVEMQHAFDVSVFNILWALVAGYRFQYTDDRMKELLDLIHECFRVLDMTGGLLNLFPLVRYVAPDLSGYRPLVRAHQPLWDFLRNEVFNKKRNLSNKGGASFIDLYLMEILKGSTENSIHYSFTDEQLLSICLDLFQAGTETTSNTLSFGILYMLHNPDIQQKVQNELDCVVGKSRLPNLNDRSHLPYTEAVLCEIQRLSNVAPLGIVHRSTKTERLGKYLIPKEAIMLVSLYSLNMDKDYWRDPHIFRPERFLNEDGALLQHAEQFIPFGLGKRRCMGENLAKSSLFLFFATFIYSFVITMPVNCGLPSLEGHDGITISPPSFKCILKPRF